jgi:hypothetical protein
LARHETTRPHIEAVHRLDLVGQWCEHQAGRQAGRGSPGDGKAVDQGVLQRAGYLMREAAKYLRNREWSMGNGQCPECCGVPEGWYGHPLYMAPNSIGHKSECVLAAALRELGETPLMQGDFTSDVEYEEFTSENGTYGTRQRGIGQ